MSKYSAGFILIALIAMIVSCTQKNKSSIDGAWSIVEVQALKQDSLVKAYFPKESQVILSNNNYSFCLTTQQSTANSWEMSDSIKIDRINNTIVNAGTYELNDSILTMKAAFALNPMFVHGEAKFRYAFNGDTLVLTGISLNSADGVQNPAYANGFHNVNKLVRVKN